MPERPTPLNARLHWLLLGAVLGLALLLSASRPLPSNDYAIYVAMGRQMLAQGGLLQRDPFTFTVGGEPFVHASWAWTALCALLHRASGYQGIRALTALCGLATLAGLYLAARRAGAGARGAAFAVLYAWILLLQNLGARSQTAVYPLFVLLAFLLARPPRPTVGALAGLVIGWLWTQLHGSFPIPILYAGAIAAGSALRARDPHAALPAGGVVLGLALGTLLGPYGPAVWGYIWSNGVVPRERGILEWGAPTLRSFAGLRLVLALALWFALTARRSRPLHPATWLLVLGFGAMTLTATRIVAWFGLATALPLALRLTSAEPEAVAPPLRPRDARLLWSMAIGWAALIAAGLPMKVTLSPDTPVALAEVLAEEPVHGRVFASMEAGGYLAWRFHEPSTNPDEPLGRMERPTFVDMRVWIFPDGIWRDFEAIATARTGWQARLDHWQVQHLLLNPEEVGADLLEAARGSADWELVAEDESGALFRRVEAMGGGHSL